jgi:hypothetical protein
MNTNFLVRQSDILDPKKTAETSICIIGCGSIGSITALTLVKMGFDNIMLIDDDIVEEHNLSNQFYRTVDIGKSKVVALREILIENGGDRNTIRAKTRRFTYNDRDSYSYELQYYNIVISCVDNMETRAAIYFYFQNTIEKDKELSIQTKLYFETRMGMQSYGIYILPINPVNQSAFLLYKQEALFPQEEAEQVRCTEKSIMFCPMDIAGKIGKLMLCYGQNIPINFFGFICDLNDFGKWLPNQIILQTNKQKSSTQVEIDNTFNIDETTEKIIYFEKDEETDAVQEELDQDFSESHSEITADVS